jgi:hypothetical protein
VSVVLAGWVLLASSWLLVVLLVPSRSRGAGGASRKLTVRFAVSAKRLAVLEYPAEFQTPAATQKVIVMSRRSREALTLAKHLWTHWRLGPGGVEVRWTGGWFRGRYRQGWEIAWDDGPTSQRMRQAALKAPVGQAIGELVHADLVGYQRSLTLTAWAVRLVHQVHDGGQVPDLADVRVEEAWRDDLERTEFPEHAPTAEEQALAEMLLRRGLRDYHQGLAAAERAWIEQRRSLPAPPIPEVLMSRALTTFGLDALAALEQVDNVVELPRHGLDRDDGLGLP